MVVIQIFVAPITLSPSINRAGAHGTKLTLDNESR